MRRLREPSGEYLTRQAAAYPEKLNEALAKALANAVSKRKGEDRGARQRCDKRQTAAHDWDPKPQKVHVSLINRRVMLMIATASGMSISGLQIG